jgi:hypothetical protein
MSDPDMSDPAASGHGTPATVSYYDSVLKVRFRVGSFRVVGLPDQPLYVRTRDGWRPYPGPAALKIRTASGWRTVIPGVS